MKLEYIKELRKKKGLTLIQMANHLNFKNASTYLKYERGEYSFDADMLPKLAEKLECKISDFF